MMISFEMRTQGGRETGTRGRGYVTGNEACARETGNVKQETGNDIETSANETKQEADSGHKGMQRDGGGRRWSLDIWYILLRISQKDLIFSNVRPPPF